MRIPWAVLALTASSSAQAAAAPALSAERVNGTYSYTDAINSHTLQVLMQPNGALKIGFDLSTKRMVTYATGVGLGQGKLRGDTATYADPQFPKCNLVLRFLPGNSVEITGSAFEECGFGMGVQPEGVYRKVDGRTPGFAFASDSQPPPVTDPQQLGGIAAAGRKQALAGPPNVASKRERVVTLAARRKELQKTLSSKLRELEQRKKAGEAADRKSYTSKASSKPTRVELLQTAQTELSAAKALGAEVRALRQELQECEDTLVQLVAEALQAGSDAKASAKETRAALDKLSKAAASDAAEASKLDTGAQQELGKARGSVGVNNNDQLVKRREQASKDDAKDDADFTAARGALTAVETSLKQRGSR